MSFSEVDISLNIQNNVDYPVQISILGNPYNLRDTSNMTREFRWDVTSFVFGSEDQLTLEYKQNNAPNYSIYSGAFSPQTLQAVVDVLNNLGIGFFNLYTELGNTYIGTYNDNYVFGNLNIFSSTSIVNTTFNVGTGFNVQALNNAIQSDGKILVVGQFTTYKGVSQPAIVRLNTDGTVDSTFTIGTSFIGVPAVLAIQSDGKILVGGGFSTYNGTGANGIIRLNNDGTIDGTFVYGTGVSGLNNSVYDIAIQTDGKIILAGSFTSYNGTAANHIIRVNSNGSVDGTFVYGTAFNNDVNSIVLQTDGKILAGGGFTNYNGSSALRIVRLNTNGSIDATFPTSSAFNNNVVNTIALQSDGKVLVGGTFTLFNGTSANNIIRLNTNGTKDNSFVYGTGFNLGTNTIAIQSNGKIVVGGQYSSYNGTSANDIIRLNTDGSIDTGWNYGSGFDDIVWSIVLSATQMYLVGNFTTFNGNTYNCIISLNQ